MKYIDLNKNNYKKKNRFRRKSSSRSRSRLLLPLFFIIFALSIFIFHFPFSITSLLTPVSVFSQIVRSGGSLKQTDGRTNILLLGVDKRSNAGYISGTRTDTIMVASIDFKKKDVALISIPRDLWVKMDQTTSAKINSAYAFGGVDLAKNMVEDVLGVPLHYFAVVDFQTFEKAVDIIGGIEVDVERSFDDYKFPKPGFENAEPRELRWEHWHFDAGPQHMDGKTALVFARSRHAEGPEGSDFARIKRQQKVIEAIKSELLSLSILTNPKKLKELYDLFSGSVETDIGWGEVEAFANLARNADEFKTNSYLIDGTWNSPNALLYTPEADAYGGQYVLLPKAGDYSEIQYFVQKKLFGVD
jgi:LCP family protein required for cell wall assembly